MNRKGESKHIPVLLDEVIEYLDLRGDEVVVDGTMNGGGHSAAILERLSEKGILIGIDLDPEAIEHAKERFQNTRARFIPVQGNFRDLGNILEELGIPAVDRVLFDLGWSTNQFSKAERGFSFRLAGPLRMRFAQDEERAPFTAWHVVNEWTEDQLETIFRTYGEERFSRRIARAIVEQREGGEISDTKQLAEIVARAVPRRFHKRGIHPATKVFQAIRIAVNDELEALREGLEEACRVLRPQGHLLVITFHSLEDRIVKHFMRDREREGVARRLTKKAITASESELAENPRARSAKLRVCEKL